MYNLSWAKHALLKIASNVASTFFANLCNYFNIFMELRIIITDEIKKLGYI